VNGQPISSRKEGKYCELFSNMGVKKSTLTKVQIKPDSTHIVSQSKDGKSKKSHTVTIGKHVHKDGKVHSPAPPVVPVSPQPIPQRNPQPQIQKVKLDLKANAPGFIWPVESRDITATYGQVGKLWGSSHKGIDVKGEMGAPIFASADGIVHLVTTEPNWGNRIVLKHSDGFQTLYSHMNGVNVSRGQQVKAGDTIGGVGSTGKSTGPHLHFEIRQNGRTLDPVSLTN